MNAYAVWANPDGVTPCDTHLYATYRVSIPRSTTCFLTVQADNYGAVIINGVQMLSSSNFNWGGGSFMDIVTGATMSYDITIDMWNAGPSCGGGNPGGTAALIQCGP